MELAVRLQKLQSYLREHDFDAFLVLSKINRQYLSGFTGSMGAVVIKNSPRPSLAKRGARGEFSGAELFVDDRYTIRARRESPLKVRNLTRLSATLSLPRRGKGVRFRIGIEDKISVREFQRLKKEHRGVKFVVTHDVVENLRAVKSAQETRYIKKAQGIIDEIFKYVTKLLKGAGGGKVGGMTEIALSQAMERLAVKLGADGMAFEPIVAFGPNAAAPHHLSGRQKIRRNNFLLLDFGVLINGYHSDFTRTLFIGSPNKKQEKVYNAVLEAQRRGIEKLTPSSPPPREEGMGEVKASEVDTAARDYITSQGFGKYFTHNTGHGVGLEIHELPNFSPQSEDILRSGMIVTVEPGIYIENWGGVRIEDMVLVTGKTPIVLSKSPKRFKEMIIKQ